MDEAHVLIVENDSYWQRELVREVVRAFPSWAVRIPSAPEPIARDLAVRRAQGDPASRGICIALAGSLPDAERQLDERSSWDLVITDIALTEANDDKGGKRLARRLRGQYPYLFVSGSDVLDTDDVRELLIDEKAIDYFNKKDFNSNRFEKLMRQVLNGPEALVKPIVVHEQVTSPTEVHIEIGWGADSYTLGHHGQRAFSLPAKYRFLFECFVRKIACAAPGEDVGLRELNTIASQESPESGVKATEALRKAISKLNSVIHAELGNPPNGHRWIESNRTTGYVLNVENIDWTITDAKKRKELARCTNSVNGTPTDPHTMQKHTRSD